MKEGIHHQGVKGMLKEAESASSVQVIIDRDVQTNRHYDQLRVHLVSFPRAKKPT
jgi:hypothetical protein